MAREMKGRQAVRKRERQINREERERCGGIKY